MSNEKRERKLQISLRTVMIACALVAFCLAPVGWVAGERQRMLRLQHEILAAREVAMESVHREQEARRQREAEATSSVRDLRRENETLRSRVEELERELRTLRGQAERSAGPVR
ncbi:MAG: hypothetical protein U0790_04830 [Isosphaeraceae bacterium]